LRKLFLVTHAESQHQVEQMTGGWYDTGLTKKGRDQAENIAGELSANQAGRATELYSSDLRRAAETAEAISRRLQLVPVLTPQLRELGHGEAEGRPRSWLQEHRNPLPTTGDPLDYQICPGAEVLRDCARRSYGALNAILMSSQANLIVVSHCFVLTYLVMAWLRVPLEGLGYCRLLAEPASLTLLSENEQGWRSLVYLNRIDFQRP
jgi:2,3-bisphosphoglycerate-dependent phosphoglycerate mutase